jgi:hypothetical protein
MGDKLLKAFIEELVQEARVKEAEISGGKVVPWGDERHIVDLEARIAELSRWRDRQKKGSEHRALYARLISRLRAELASARKTATKKQEQIED